MSTWEIIASEDGAPRAQVAMCGGTLAVFRLAGGGLQGTWSGPVPEMTRDWAVEHLGRLVDGEENPTRRQHWEDERQRVARGPALVLEENPELVLRTNMAHRQRFFMPSADFAGVSGDMVADIMAHHWQDAPPVRHGADRNAKVLAFETALLVAACWEAPAAVRAHFRQTRWHLHEAFRDESPPALWTSDTDPI